jgi:hypothetical protein
MSDEKIMHLLSSKTKVNSLLFAKEKGKVWVTPKLILQLLQCKGLLDLDRVHMFPDLQGPQETVFLFSPFLQPCWSWSLCFHGQRKVINCGEGLSWGSEKGENDT